VINCGGVAYGSGQIVIIPQNSTTSSGVSSPDGVTWTPIAIGTGATYQMRDLAYGSGQFVSVG